jgi:hypothetical protein
MLIDRLVHLAEIIDIDAESYRLKEAKERAAKKAAPRATRSSPSCFAGICRRNSSPKISAGIPRIFTSANNRCLRRREASSELLPRTAARIDTTSPPCRLRC